MPPQPGIFALPYGTTHSQGGGLASSSQGGGGGGKASRAGLTSFPNPQQDSNMVGAINGDMGLGGGGGYHHSTQQQQQQHLQQHPSSHAQHSSLGLGHPLSQLHQNQHLHHNFHQHGGAVAGPSSRIHAAGSMDDLRKEKKRKDISGKLGKEIGDRRDDGRHFTESISALHHTAHVLATRPEMNSLFKLRLFPLSLERSAQLAQFEAEERYAIECAHIAYDEERERVEEEWKKGRQRIRERLLEGIEERRRRAREEKEGEGIVGDASLDSHSRPPITRKLRNKLGTSPPPTPHYGPNTNHSISISGSNAFNFTSNNLTGTLNGMSTAHHLPFTMGPFTFLNPHSLSVDELPSPFPLPLTSTNITNGGSGATSGSVAGNGNGPSNGGRRRAKGGGGNQGQALGGLGKSLLLLNTTKDIEIENDLGEIRRGNKRRRAVVPGASKTI